MSEPNGDCSGRKILRVLNAESDTWGKRILNQSLSCVRTPVLRELFFPHLLWLCVWERYLILWGSKPSSDQS